MPTADEGIYLLNAHANRIVGNTVQGHGAAGLYVKGSNRNTIEGNTFTNDPIQLTAKFPGQHLPEQHDNRATH